MTETVIDASVLVAALGIDSALGRDIREMLRGRQLIAPSLIDLEVASVLRRLVLRNAVSIDRAEQVLADLAEMPVKRFPHEPLIARCWELRDNLTVYDASYVALAETLGAPLMTADAPLSKSPGIRCRVELIRLEN